MDNQALVELWSQIVPSWPPQYRLTLVFALLHFTFCTLLVVYAAIKQTLATSKLRRWRSGVFGRDDSVIVTAHDQQGQNPRSAILSATHCAVMDPQNPDVPPIPREISSCSFILTDNGQWTLRVTCRSFTIYLAGVPDILRLLSLLRKYQVPIDLLLPEDPDRSLLTGKTPSEVNRLRDAFQPEQILDIQWDSSVSQPSNQENEPYKWAAAISRQRIALFTYHEEPLRVLSIIRHEPKQAHEPWHFSLSENPSSHEFKLRIQDDSATKNYQLSLQPHASGMLLPIIQSKDPISFQLRENSLLSNIISALLASLVIGGLSALLFWFPYASYQKLLGSNDAYNIWAGPVALAGFLFGTAFSLVDAFTAHYDNKLEIAMNSLLEQTLQH